MPGLYIAGVRDKRIITGALAGSTLISLFLLTYTAVERGRRGKAQGKLMTGRSTKPLRGAQNKLTAAQRAYVSAVEEDVHSNPDAYKPHVRANPAEWALQLIDNLDESEVKRLTREQRAETKLIARLTTTPKLRRRRV
jgi:hypothetical protein